MLNVSQTSIIYYYLYIIIHIYNIQYTDFFKYFTIIIILLLTSLSANAFNVCSYENIWYHCSMFYRRLFFGMPHSMPRCI